jgi:thiol-disulfide isomerase/thioredoxin
VILSILLAAVLGTSVPTVTLRDLERRFERGGDTTYVVNFWATWCKPCVAELPYFDKLARTSNARPVVVLLVSLDRAADKATKVEPFLRARGYRCEAVLLDEPKPHLWIDRVDPSWSGAIPATLFVQGARRAFHEQEFTQATLDSTFTRFTASP